MEQGIDKALRAQLQKQLGKQAPYSYLNGNLLDDWLNNSKIVFFKPGQRLLRPDELNSRLYLILTGTIRLLIRGSDSEGINTLDKRGAGQLIGWSSLLRGEATEFIQASTEVKALSLCSKKFIELIKAQKEFAEYFFSLKNTHEAYSVIKSANEQSPIKPKGWENDIQKQVETALVTSLSSDDDTKSLPNLPSGWEWHMSTPGVEGIDVGMIIPKNFGVIKSKPGFSLPYRLIGINQGLTTASIAKNEKENQLLGVEEQRNIDLVQLGIMEMDYLEDDDNYPFVKGNNEINEVMAVTEMVSLEQNVPFRRDSIKKIIEGQFQRNKRSSLELIAGLCEMLGMTSQLATTEKEYISSIESPAVFFIQETPVVLYGFRKGKAIIADPREGIKRINIEDIQKEIDEKIKFIIPRRNQNTPTSKFGWHWFTPLLKKYKKALVLVFASSMLAQLFGLAIPLLLQQIIDKVLSQGNLSSLNVLGTAMVVMALFQGILQALRTYIFVDTTDRMDLTLGSAVIDRLLALPLNYFEKRPVGELSQRLGELNTIRSFLTGTALISVLNLVFAVIYLVVMFVYSPLLSGVALSTFPLYVLLVFGVAPIYKSLIRKRAIASARTQSHLIEVIGGIQTVKAQHFELTSRWKWQDRYRVFVAEGFKSKALTSTAGEIGAFLNSISGLLVLWVGMWLVLQGEFTLGQLIAFRIISGNVTGPLLQLAGLYQGFQGVQLSMERLSDIIDQNPELNNSAEIGQISLPAIKGNVRFENVRFRFGPSGPYQLDDVSVDISAGSFVGIVGQSGSGKSTLMKLLPRLYQPKSGRIFIDDYDINKVDLSSLRRQVGIVPQDSLLFEGTIAENIALNDPQASTESIINAAKIACAHEFIMGLGQGYATPVAEKGSNLSGGQRQRIAIARTVLSNPQLLIMDEATSALDYDTERQLCLNLQNWAQDRTVFFITHRLTTIKSSEKIIVMHQGRVEETGSHNELIELNGRYSTLFRQQESSGE